MASQIGGCLASGIELRGRYRVDCCGLGSDLEIILSGLSLRGMSRHVLKEGTRRANRFRLREDASAGQASPRSSRPLRVGTPSMQDRSRWLLTRSRRPRCAPASLKSPRRNPVLCEGPPRFYTGRRGQSIAATIRQAIAPDRRWLVAPAPPPLRRIRLSPDAAAA